MAPLRDAPMTDLLGSAWVLYDNDEPGCSVETNG
jgi:hypothetical protein